MPGIIGKKVGMTRVFDGLGRSIAVTVVEAGPCSVVQVKTVKTDGYEAIQVGFEDKKEKRTTKPEANHFAKAGVKPKKAVREFRLSGEGSFSPGDELKVDLFTEGDKVSVVGWSKGKGFQGVVKRHGFSGGPKTHGQSDRLRAPGSVGQSSYPSRVFKGLRMAGRMGNRRVTLKSRRVIRVIPEKNVLMIEGAIPGASNGLVLIRK